MSASGHCATVTEPVGGEAQSLSGMAAEESGDGDCTHGTGIRAKVQGAGSMAETVGVAVSW